MAKVSANYEVVYIIDPMLSEEDTAALVAKFKTLAEQNGSAVEVEEWGKRKLAYEINGLTDGDYTLIDFEADPASIAELDRVLHIMDAVVRYMITRRDDRAEAVENA